MLALSDQLDWPGFGWWAAITLPKRKGPPMTKNQNRARSASAKPVGTVKPSVTGKRAAAAEGTPPPAKPASKIDQVTALLCSPDGATLSELVAATGWQPHTTRAALTGLKKRGHALTSDKIAGVRRYHVRSPS
jgi:hypothetical protein